MTEIVENVAGREALETLKVGEQYSSQAKLLQRINLLYYSPSERATGIYGLDGDFHRFPTQMEKVGICNKRFSNFSLFRSR